MTDSPLRSAVATPARTAGGARTELRLRSSGPEGADYEARWFLGAARSDEEATRDGADVPAAHGNARIAAGGEVTIDVAAGHLPGWLRVFTDKLLRTTARSVVAGRYPRRLTRWRDDDGP